VKPPPEIADLSVLERRPLNPYLILAIAIVLPGAGHVFSGMPGRGLVFVFFMLLFGWITLHLTTPDQSLVGRYAGGLFVYAISIMDAYKWARLRWELSRKTNPA
jgi:hypothetical protein